MSTQLVPVDELVTIDDIAKRLKMSVNTACNIVRGRGGRSRVRFPKPLVGSGIRAVWLWGEVQEWYEHSTPKELEGRRRARHAESQTFKSQSWAQGGYR